MSSPEARAESDDHGPGRRQHVVVSPRMEGSSTPRTRPSRPAGHTRRTSRAGPAELLPARRRRRRPMPRPSAPHERSWSPASRRPRSAPGMIASAATQPLNGSAAGTWNVQGGYGLVNAIKALNAVDQLRASETTSPVNGTNGHLGTQRHPVHLQQAGRLLQPLRRRPDLHLGAPGRDRHRRGPRSRSTTPPTRPLSSTSRSASPSPSACWGPTASYTFSAQSPANGGRSSSPRTTRTSSASSPISFHPGRRQRRPDHRQQPPSAAGASASSSSKAARRTRSRSPTSSSSARAAASVWPPSPSDLSSYINLNSDPRATISYNPQTFVVTLDYSNLPQTELPSDDYAIVVWPIAARRWESPTWSATRSTATTPARSRPRWHPRSSRTTSSRTWDSRRSRRPRSRRSR